MPWPDVQPPASRAPNTIVIPPAIASIAIVRSTDDRLLTLEKPSLMAMRLTTAAEQMMPHAKTTEGVKNCLLGASSAGLCTTFSLIHRATSSYAAEAPMSCPVSNIVASCATPIKAPPCLGDTRPATGRCWTVLSVAEASSITVRHIRIQVSNRVSGWMSNALAISRDFSGSMGESSGLSCAEVCCAKDCDRARLIAHCSLMKRRAPIAPPSATSIPFVIPVPACTSAVPGHAPVIAIPIPIRAPPMTLPSY